MIMTAKKSVDVETARFIAVLMAQVAVHVVAEPVARTSLYEIGQSLHDAWLSS